MMAVWAGMRRGLASTLAGRGAKPLVRIACTFVLLSCLPATAWAHVKWFTITNVHDAPRALAAVLSGPFLAVLAVATLLVFSGFLLDGWVARRWPKILSSGPAGAVLEERLVRAASGAYFICSAYAGGTILTPELHTGTAWVAVIQFMIAASLVWRGTCVLAGLGVLVLYVDAIVGYGFFHLTDYVFFPCLVLYLASLSLPLPRLRRLRESLLVGGLAFSLAWTAIEKFLYPQWTYAVMATHPSIGLGLPMPLVVVIAGFVEFTLAFYLVTGRGLLRLGGLGYASIFMAAMPAFGKLDVFGHLVILSILAIVALRGKTPMQDAPHLSGSGLVADAAWITALYAATLSMFFVMYYVMQTT